MDKKAIKEIAVASAMYSLGSILGPLLVIGGIGLILDKIFQTHPWFLLGGVLVAFVVTNVLLFKKIKKINKMMDRYQKEAVAEKKDDNKSIIEGDESGDKS